MDEGEVLDIERTTDEDAAQRREGERTRETNIAEETGGRRRRRVKKKEKNKLAC